MGTIATKLEYLNNTKEKIRDSINLTGANIGTSDTFRSYADKLKLGYIDIINNGIDNLYNNFPKVSGIGSNLSLTPTYEAPMKLNEIQGDTLQDGTPTPNTPVPIQSVTGLQNVNVCGKNLLPPKASTSTKNGVTFTKNNDGTYTVNGTATANAVFSILAEGNTTNPTLSTGTYTLSGCPSDGGSNTYKLDISVGSYNQDTGNGVTFTLSEVTQINYVRILVYNGQTINKVFKPMLEKSSTATSYEPYKGNTYEVNLGKNLIPNNITSQTSNGLTITKNDDSSVTIDGTASALVTLNLIDKNFILPAGQYTLSGCPTGGGANTWRIDINNGQSSAQRDEGNGATFTITEDLEVFNVRIRIANGAVVNNLTFKPMLEKGSQATSYSPYFTPIELNKIGDYQDSIKKSTGKNLFDKNNASLLNAYINSSSSSSDYKKIISNNNARTLYIPCKSNTTYTISKIANQRFIIGSCVNLPDINTTCTNETHNNTATSLTITTGANDKYLVVFYYLSTADTSTEEQIRNSIMINEGSTALPYEPYGKVWYVEKQIGKVVLDGSETQWSRWFSTPGVYSCSNLIQTINNATTINCISNYYSNTYNRAYVRSHLDTIDNNVATTDGELIIANKNYTTLDNFKNWLSTHNTTVYTILATPEYTEITNTELIEDLETLYTAKSQEGTTNISITSEDLEMILNVSALKSE